MNKQYLNKNPRKGCKDCFNAYMCKGSLKSDCDYPIFDQSDTIPNALISFTKAKELYNKQIIINKEFHIDAFIHFYEDDYLFDNYKNSIWLFPKDALKIIKHFSGIISPDYSTYLDFPSPLKYYNIYRSRVFSYWITKHSIPVIMNVRWSLKDSYKYYFSGIKKNSTLAIGTIASGLKENINKPLFTDGFYYVLTHLKPKIIIVYGSSNYKCFDKAKELGVQIITFPSETSIFYSKQKEKNYEQTK